MIPALFLVGERVEFRALTQVDCAGPYVNWLNDGEVCLVSLQKIDPVYRAAEFAILIGGKDCSGKGYSKEAGRLLLDHGFQSLNLHRVGRRRQALFTRNRYLDVVEFGVSKPEYMRRLHSARHARPAQAAP